MAVGYLKLLAVHPGTRRQGLGREPCWPQSSSGRGTQGAGELHLAGSAPFYLWPGVDVRATAMLCLVEAAGYDETGAAFDMSMPAAFRRAGARGGRGPPDADRRGRGTVDDAGRAASGREWLDEQRRAIEQGTCLAAFDGGHGRRVGFACHSVNRAGVVRAHRHRTRRSRHRGIGRACWARCASDLMVAGFGDVEICWIGPVGFYAAGRGLDLACLPRPTGDRKP